MRDNSAYRTKYGAWAGFPNGNPPDFERCCVQVHGPGRGVTHHQCGKKRGYGPGEAYCATHDPEAAKRRADAATAKQEIRKRETQMTLVKDISPTGIKAMRERTEDDMPTDGEFQAMAEAMADVRRREDTKDRRELAGQINEATQEYGALAKAVTRDKIADDEALAIGLALQALKMIVAKWESP